MSLCFSVLLAQNNLNQLIGIASLEEKPVFVKHQPRATDFVDFKPIGVGFECTKGNREMLHMVDLDNDGDQDLIFDGPCAPYKQVIIYINDGGKLRIIWDEPGEVISVSQHEEGSEVLVWNEACCCNNYKSLSSIGIQKLEEKPNVESLSWHQNIQVPINFYTKSQQAIGVFRSSPFIEDQVRKDECTGESVIGNQDFILENQVSAFKITSQGNMQLLAVEVLPNCWNLGWQEINKGN